MRSDLALVPKEENYPAARVFPKIEESGAEEQVVLQPGNAHGENTMKKMQGNGAFCSDGPVAERPTVQTLLAGCKKLVNASRSGDDAEGGCG